MGRIRVAVVGATVLVALVFVSAPSDAQRPAGSGPDHRARTIAYWTPERVRSAVAREVVAHDVPDHAVPQAKGGKPGSGGGSGSPWINGGKVQATTGKVLFTLSGANYVCSGSVVDNTQGGARALVLTAGHCVHDGDGATWATNWMFVPDFQHSNHDFNCATTAYGCWVAEALVTTGSWADGSDLDYDVAFAVVGPGGKQATSTDDLDITVGSQNIGFNVVDRANLPLMHSFGYPHATPYDGTTLTYCKGTVKLDVYSPDLGMACDMTGGSSGGPWYVAFDETSGTGLASSLNSFKYRFDRKTMWGPYFGYYAEATYSAANGLGGTTNQKVSPPAQLP